MESTLLTEIVIILGLSVLVVLIFQRLKLPTILGFLLTGVIAGPHGLSLVQESESVHMLSETGVILLLFVIGLEFSPKDLLAMRRTVLVGGGLQVGLTIVFTAGILMLTGMKAQEGIFLGFCLSLSSTAIVLRMLQDQNQITSPQGRISLGVLIFQDIIVVPMMLVTPILAGQGGEIGMELLTLLGKTLLVGAVLILGSRFVLPRLLDEVAKTRSRELFVLTTVLICFSVAGLTYSMGLSLALGAFLAGLLLAESDYSHQATGNILPFREVFTSFFFVSIGMLLDAQFFFEKAAIILLLALAVTAIKTGAATLAGLALKYPMRIALMSGLALFQVGEFAFILANIGQQYALMNEEMSQYFLAVSILSMAATPFVMQQADKITQWVTRAPFLDLIRQGIASPETAPDDLNTKNLQDHVIIIGFGLNGHNLALAAKSAQIPYVILEINSETVKAERQLGEPILFGDATDPFILEHVHVNQARVAVIAISDPVATRKVVAAIRNLCRTVYIIVRTRFVKEIEEVLRLGADEVIPEEFETSIEIFSRVLDKYLVPEEAITAFTQGIRSENYEMLRPMEPLRLRPKSASLLNIPELRFTCLTVPDEVPGITGKSVAEIALRQQYQISLLAIQHGDTLLTQVTPDTLISRDDQLYVVGKPEDIARFGKKLKE